jgi:hypothetical protein
MSSFRDHKLAQFLRLVYLHYNRSFREKVLKILVVLLNTLRQALIVDFGLFLGPLHLPNLCQNYSLSFVKELLWVILKLQ